MIAKIKRFIKLWPFHNLRIGSLDGVWWLDAEQYQALWRTARDVAAAFPNVGVDIAIGQIKEGLHEK